MRGKPSIYYIHFYCIRITPACAGKTAAGPRTHIEHGDHPRVCGENRLVEGILAVPLGSPPRVRGKPEIAGEDVFVTGITPACAGKTSARSARGAARRDHPRVCGENFRQYRKRRVVQGSPPRVRGKLSGIVEDIPPAGITPACAGKTGGWLQGAAQTGDHPRVCGENSCAGRFRSLPPGSPPRVRGKPRRTVQSVRSVGITPACAGKTLSSHSSTFRNRDHPRVCGENTSEMAYFRG